MKGRGGGTGCGTRVVPVVLSGSFVAVERGETLNTDTQTQESEVNTCNSFVGKETYLDVMFMCIYYVHVLYVNTFFYRVPLGLFLFVSRVGSIHCQLVVPALQTTIHLSNSSLIFQSRTVGSRIAVAFGLPRWSNWYNNATIDGGPIP